MACQLFGAVMGEKQDAKDYLYREISTQWNKVDVDKDNVIGEKQFFQYFDAKIAPNISDRKIEIIERNAAIAFANGGLLKKSEWENRIDVSEVQEKAIERVKQVKKGFVEPAVKDLYETAGRLGPEISKATDVALEKAKKVDVSKAMYQAGEVLEGVSNWLKGTSPQNLPAKGSEKNR